MTQSCELQGIQYLLVDSSFGFLNISYLFLCFGHSFADTFYNYFLAIILRCIFIVLFQLSKLPSSVLVGLILIPLIFALSFPHIVLLFILFIKLLFVDVVPFLCYSLLFRVPLYIILYIFTRIHPSFENKTNIPWFLYTVK